MIMYGCGGGNGATSPTPTVDVTGTWSGTYSSSLVPSRLITLNLTQSGANVTGTYSTTVGTVGTVNGTVSGNTINFTLNQTTPSCPGTFRGTATVSGTTMTFTFTGSDCLGTHTNGQGNATKQTRYVPFKRTPSLGMYGLGTQIEPNVDTLASATTLTDSIYNIPATTSAGTINIDQNGKKFHNIGIQLFSSEKPVDTLYIYVNKDILSDTALTNISNWKVYQSDFNLPDTWKEITVQTVTISAYDPLNNIYRYEIKFSAPQNALFFRAINMEIATVSDVSVTEIEAFGTEVIP